MAPGRGRPTLAVGVVSAGRVGAVFGAALARAGHKIVAASGVSAQSRRRADELLPGVPLLPPDETVAAADLVVLAIPDDALAGTVRGLAATSSFRAGQIVLHTSGAHGVDVLAPATEAGALSLALHPAMTFTGRAEDLDRLAACCIGVTAADDKADGVDVDAAWHVGEALAVELGAEPVRIRQSVRPLYHAALTHGANHLVTLVADCADVLGGAGIDDAQKLLGPLLSAALDNALRHGDRALTGPVARGDVHTVRAHLSELARQAPDVLPAYRAMAIRTAMRANDIGLLTNDAAAELLKILESR